MAHYVSAQFTAKAGQGDALFALISQIVPLVRAEEGCIRYDLHRGSQNPDRFFFYEIWSGPEALQKHAASAHMADFGKKSGALLEGAGVVETWNAGDVKD